MPKKKKQLTARKKVALIGLPPPRWHSLSKTFEFYRSALAKYFTVLQWDEFPSGPQVEEVDAGVVFSGGMQASRQHSVTFPLLYQIAGGAVLEYQQLKEATRDLKDHDRLIVNCSSDVAIFRTISERCAERCEILPLPVNCDLFKPISRSEAKVALGIDPDKKVLGFVARLIPEKNLHRFIRILASVVKRGAADTIGVVVGDFWADYPPVTSTVVDYKSFVERLAAECGVQDRIKLLPAKLSSEQLSIAYNAFDLLVHPTMCVDENFGYVPLEALSCGVPVAATAYGGLKDTLAGTESAAMFETWATVGGMRTDWLAFTDAVTSMISRPSADFSTIARGHILNNYSHQALAEKLRDIIHRAGGEVRPLGKLSSVDSDEGDLVSEVVNDAGRWLSLQKPVKYYVSRSPPRVTADGAVYKIDSLRYAERGKIQSNDPLWNLSYSLEPALQAVMQEIGELPTSVAQLLAHNRATVSQLQELADIGLLIPRDL